MDTNNNTLPVVELDLNTEITQQQWLDIGEQLGRFEDNYMWLVGKWWLYGKNWRYGDRKALVESKDWKGPRYETCAMAAKVYRRFIESDVVANIEQQTIGGQPPLSFSHHKEVAFLNDESEAEKILNHCISVQEETGKPPSTKAVREMVNEVKAKEKLGKLQHQENQQAFMDSLTYEEKSKVGTLTPPKPKPPTKKVLSEILSVRPDLIQSTAEHLRRQLHPDKEAGDAEMFHQIQSTIQSDKVSDKIKLDKLVSVLEAKPWLIEVAWKAISFQQFVIPKP